MEFRRGEQSKSSKYLGKGNPNVNTKHIKQRYGKAKTLWGVTSVCYALQMEGKVIRYTDCAYKKVPIHITFIWSRQKGQAEEVF